MLENVRLLLLEDRPQIRALVRQHVRDAWVEADICAHPPAQRGPLPPEFLAQGYDAVLLPAESANDADAVHALCSRAGFAPVIVLAGDSTSALEAKLLAAGAFGVIALPALEPARLTGLLRSARREHRRQLADWRVSPEAEEARRFGDARIPGYRRARLLARGSVSHLYLAESEKAGALVALKVTPSLRDESGVDQAFARFLQEYEIAQRIRHPNIVRLYELGVADDHAYLAMEYFAHGDLRRRMRRGITTSEALVYGAQIARALVAIHALGTLHRDLKPGNVMLRADGHLALIDFGLAKQAAFEMEITDTGLIFGTPHYMSPEQGHGQTLDERSDLYSLGVVLYEMLTGQKPFNATNPMAVIYMHRNAPLPRLPPEQALLQPLVSQLLAKQPQDRPASAADAVRLLDSARESWLAQTLLA